MLKMRWTQYKDRPGATFLSFSLNFIGIPIFLGVVVAICGITEKDTWMIVGGVIFAAACILYVVFASKYLRKLGPQSIIDDLIRKAGGAKKK